MSNFRTHIASFLLVLFLVPQVNNALHYFVLHHDFAHKHDVKEKESKKSNKHNCETSIFKIPAVTTVVITSVPIFVTCAFTKRIPQYISLLFKEHIAVYRLRGPPRN